MSSFHFSALTFSKSSGCYLLVATFSDSNMAAAVPGVTSCRHGWGKKRNCLFLAVSFEWVRLFQKPPSKPHLTSHWPSIAPTCIHHSEKAMATHSSTLAWQIPWMEQPCRLQSMGSLGVGHDRVNSLSLFIFHFHALEKAMAPHSSILAWKIPWTVEPGGLQSMGSMRVGHDWATSLSLFTFMHWRRKWQPTPVFLPGESQGWRSLVAAVYGVAQSQTRLKQLSSSSSRGWETQSDIQGEEYWLKSDSTRGTSLVVQWLRLHIQCKGPEFNPWSES